jgi:uncharacterized protein YigE (DUF2233 family)
LYQTLATALSLLIAVEATARPQESKEEDAVTLTTLRDGEVELDVIKVDLRRAKLRMLWQRAPGEPLGTPRAGFEWLKSQGQRPLAVMNAGIYGQDDKPLGLHVEEGSILHALDRRRGGGNFYLIPNGVFHVGRGGAGIHETAAYAAWADRSAVRQATQSGPLLLFGGKIHPRFLPNSQSALIRNGVGVRGPWEVYLVISRSGINFYRFARFFRDRLGCQDALYLDGNISRLHAPKWGRSAAGVLGTQLGEGHFVGLLAVLDTKEPRRLPKAP